MPTPKPKNIDDYIAGFPKESQKILEQVRTTIHKALPDAEETISYAIPAFCVGKACVVYFSGYKHHISIYPAPKTEAFQEKISANRTGKGTIQFPLDKPIPYNLISDIAKLLAKESAERIKAKKK